MISRSCSSLIYNNGIQRVHLFIKSSSNIQRKLSNSAFAIFTNSKEISNSSNSTFSFYKLSNSSFIRTFCTNSLPSKDPPPPTSSSSSTDSKYDQIAAEPTEFVIQLSPEEIKELSGGDEETEKRIKYIQLEIEVYRQEGFKVPTSLSTRRWKEALLLKSRGQRRKYYEYLWGIEMKKLSEVKKKEAKRTEREEMFRERGSLEEKMKEDPHHMHYSLNRNTIFIRTYDTTINFFHHSKVVSAMQFSSPLIIDLSFDEFMSLKEQKNCAGQLDIAITANRSHRNPFHLQFLNIKRDLITMQTLEHRIPILNEPTYPLTLSEKSYLDLFPKEKLVYLTPDAPQELTEYNDNDIYIIGAMVDKSDPRPFTKAKAKKEGIRMKKLPLDTFLFWGQGGKSLTVNQVVSIMLDFRDTGNWKKALENNVPKRKLFSNENDNNESEIPKSVTSGFVIRPRKESKTTVFQDYDYLKKRRGGFR